MTIHARLRKGWSVESVLTFSARARFRWIEFNGQRKTLGAWAKDLGIAPHTLIARFKAGWSAERALGVAQQNVRLLTFRGKTQMIGEWAKELGVTLTCLSGRLDRGWTVERTLSTPPNMTNTRKRKLQDSDL